ncbi:LysM peptidoglycan-binding domain-containing protein [Paenibacillus thermoaerophilus]|uniref:LysM peptidoglycan-binding domain-containing protein n=1 Tax=Paenibacillus thermoaerophilus TaxID=1215385 RepID=UPI001476F786|nr:LysM peptidoglycan-binding domain-containing protein [Paenibacillus thermoaerophilus]
MKIHIVKAGETLYLLAKKYGLELAKLIAANPQIKDPDKVDVGQKVKIPSPAKPVAQPVGPVQHVHKAVQDDTLWKLAKQWNVPLDAIIAANPHLKNPNILLTGDTVFIPAVGHTHSGTTASQAVWGTSSGAGHADSNVGIPNSFNPMLPQANEHNVGATAANPNQNVGPEASMIFSANVGANPNLMPSVQQPSNVQPQFVSKPEVKQEAAKKKESQAAASEQPKKLTQAAAIEPTHKPNASSVSPFAANLQAQSAPNLQAQSMPNLQAQSMPNLQAQSMPNLQAQSAPNLHPLGFGANISPFAAPSGKSEKTFAPLSASNVGPNVFPSDTWMNPYATGANPSALPYGGWDQKSVSPFAQYNTQAIPAGAYPMNVGPNMGMEPMNVGPNMGVQPMNVGPNMGVQPMNVGPNVGVQPMNVGPNLGMEPMNVGPNLGMEPMNVGPQANVQPYSAGPNAGVLPAQATTKEKSMEKGEFPIMPYGHGAYSYGYGGHIYPYGPVYSYGYGPDCGCGGGYRDDLPYADVSYLDAPGSSITDADEDEGKAHIASSSKKSAVSRKPRKSPQSQSRSSSRSSHNRPWINV